MNVAIFGASGMVGQGVLQECLRDTGVERVLVIGRTSAGRQHAKLREVLVPDLFDVAARRHIATSPMT
jgi:saccharopine dehydrogenase-like NADP-dependent oxidoreductase